jgi:hypothetical protein
MNQLTLFDRPAQIARKSDPITSHQSAAETEPQLNGLQSCCMIVLGRAISPRTANEIAAECVKRYGKMSESYRKRMRGCCETAFFGLVRIQNGHSANRYSLFQTPIEENKK